MRKITVTQINWNGKNENRAFAYWVKPGAVAMKIRSIERAFDMDHTTITIS